MDDSSTKKAIKGMSSQTLITLCLGLIDITVFSIMSRLLSQSDFGYYAAITAVTIVFSSFSETGIGSAIIQRKEIDNRFINNSFTISFAFGSFLTFLLLIFAKPISHWMGNDSMVIPLMLMSITLLCNCLTSVNISILYRNLQFLRVGVINLIALLVSSITAIMLALYGYGIYSIISKPILTSMITLLLSLRLCKTPFKFQFDTITFFSIFKFSGWLMASVFFRNLAQQFDRLLLGRLLSIQSLGAYNRPKEFINTVSSKFGGIFDTALFPVLSQLQDNPESMKNAYRRSMYMLNLASFLLAIGFIFNGSLIIRVFLGNNWSHLLPIFQILSASLIFSFDARLADCYLRSLGMTKQQFYFRIFDVILKTASVLIGYRWDIIGVAAFILTSDLIMVIIKHVYISLKIHISIIDGIQCILSSWIIGLPMIPVLILLHIILPNGVVGEIIMAILFCAVSAIPLILFPKLAGKRYEDEVFNQFVRPFNDRILHLLRNTKQ